MSSNAMETMLDVPYQSRFVTKTPLRAQNHISLTGNYLRNAGCSFPMVVFFSTYYALLSASYSSNLHNNSSEHLSMIITFLLPILAIQSSETGRERKVSNEGSLILNGYIWPYLRAISLRYT